MIADTLVVIMVCITTSQPKQNNFKALFDEADKQFNKEYKLNLEELKKASAEAAKEAFEKTKKELEKLSTKNSDLWKQSLELYRR